MRNLLPAWTTGTILLLALLVPGLPGQDGRLGAAVMEFMDQWTGRATGAARLLEAAGMKIVPLDRAPSDLGVDLIVFGSFVNNHATYRDYVKKHRRNLQQFVEQGGVVLEMTQSDQNGATVRYLPDSLHTRRVDTDLHPVLVMVEDHPLLAGWTVKGSVQTHQGRPAVWESLLTWRGFQVVLASAPGPEHPVLLVGAHGRGRFLVTSLWLDKAFKPDGKPAVGPEGLRVAEGFFKALASYVRLVHDGKAPEVVPTPSPAEKSVGPMVGHVDTKRARIWYRPTEIGTHQLALRGPDGKVLATVKAVATTDHDRCVVFDVGGLRPDTLWSYEISRDGKRLEGGAQCRFRTPPAPGTPARVSIGFGSCGPSKPSSVWTRVRDEGCEAFVFLGDTPYVDTAVLELARGKHRKFLAQPEIASMIRGIPCWGTWDDHDFGKNDGHGDFSGKTVTRRAFVEYRANATFGHLNSKGGHGVYTSFRYGPVEVFLLDPRWFSRTEKSFADPTKPTCLGHQQWDWFRVKLLESTAPFKVIATGMIWDDKKNGERDDWDNYKHEREAIFDFIASKRIEGCVLMGGDIHVSRALRYKMKDRIGYDLWQFIISPLHDHTIKSLDVPHPDLVHHALEPHVFLRLVADTTRVPATLVATWINRGGRKIFEVRLTEQDLRR